MVSGLPTKAPCIGPGGDITTLGLGTIKLIHQFKLHSN